MGRPTKYNKESAQRYLDAIRRGETKARASVEAGACYDVTNEWCKRFPSFADAVKNAEEEYRLRRRDELLADCRASLGELIKGFERNVPTTELENDGSGNPRIKKVINKTQYFPPNVAAVIFALTNLDPEHWKNRQSTDISGKVEADNKADINLSAIPDELLGQVVDAIRNGKDLQ